MASQKTYIFRKFIVKKFRTGGYISVPPPTHGLTFCEDN